MKFDHKEMFLYDTYSRVEGVIGPDRATQLYAELSEHIDHLQREYEGRGVQPELAKKAALTAIGSSRSIAKEFARHSISRPWRSWPIWVGLMTTLAYFILKSSPVQADYRALALMGMLAVMIGGLCYRRTLPIKPLLVSAAIASAVVCVIEARSVRLWAERVPYARAHNLYLAMQKDHAKFLTMEGSVAVACKEIRNTLISQELHAGPNTDLLHSTVLVPMMKYTLNSTYFSFLNMPDTGSFQHTPTLVTKQYPVGRAAVAIDEKLGTISAMQRERRNEMGAVQRLINTSSTSRVMGGIPYICFAIGISFGGAYLCSAIGASISLAVVSRRRRIIS